MTLTVTRTNGDLEVTSSSLHGFFRKNNIQEYPFLKQGRLIDDDNHEWFPSPSCQQLVEAVRIRCESLELSKISCHPQVWTYQLLVAEMLALSDMGESTSLSLDDSLNLSGVATLTSLPEACSVMPVAGLDTTAGRFALRLNDNDPFVVIDTNHEGDMDALFNENRELPVTESGAIQVSLNALLTPLNFECFGDPKCMGAFSHQAEELLIYFKGSAGCNILIEGEFPSNHVCESRIESWFDRANKKAFIDSDGNSFQGAVLTVQARTAMGGSSDELIRSLTGNAIKVGQVFMESDLSLKCYEGDSVSLDMKKSAQVECDNLSLF
ncbi:hypothetical protein AB6D11_06040 [Vibrio splendidus]